MQMAQLLQHHQEHYVPCSTKANSKITLEKIPLHGDQLFEMSFGLTGMELMNAKDLKVLTRSLQTGMPTTPYTR